MESCNQTSIELSRSFGHATTALGTTSTILRRLVFGVGPAKSLNNDFASFLIRLMPGCCMFTSHPEREA